MSFLRQRCSNNRKRPKFHVRHNPTFADRTNGIKCTRKFTEAIASRFSCIPVKYKPESDHLTDRLEDVDKLVLSVICSLMKIHC
jgi:hypothetical protein